MTEPNVYVSPERQVAIDMEKATEKIKNLDCHDFPYAFPIKVYKREDLQTVERHLKIISDLVVDDRLIGRMSYNGPTSDEDYKPDGCTIKVSVSLLHETEELTTSQLQRIIRHLTKRSRYQAAEIQDLNNMVDTLNEWVLQKEGKV